MPAEISEKASKLVNDLSYLPSIIGAMGINIAEAQKLLNADYVTTLDSVTTTLARMVQASAKDEAAFIKEQQAEAVETLTKNVRDEAVRELLANDPNAAEDLIKKAKEKKPSAAQIKAAKKKAAEEAPAKLEAAKNQAVQMMLQAFAPSLYQYTETTLDFSADFSQTSNTAINAGIGGGLFGFTVSAGMSMAFGYDYRAAGRITSVLHAVRPGAELNDALLTRAKELEASKLTMPALKAIDADMLTKAANTFEKITGVAIETDDMEPGETPPEEEAGGEG